MTAPQAWLLTGGLHGMMSQVFGLARILKLSHIHHVCRLKKPWCWLPSHMLSPKPLWFNQFPYAHPPKVLISCGRHAALAAAYLKKQYGSAVYTIHIQDPKISLTHFDSIIAPKHDGLVSTNVLETTGALFDFPDKHHDRPTCIINESRQVVAVYIGGPTRNRPWLAKDLLASLSLLMSVAGMQQVKLVMIPSNRTPLDLYPALQDLAGQQHTFINRVDKTIYQAMLQYADYFVVTPDSVSMISEAASTGKPIYLLPDIKQAPNKRFKIFYQQLLAQDIIRSWDGRFEHWSYKPLHEAKRVVPLLRERMKHVYVTECA